MAKVLVTGSAGFIGMHTSLTLATQGFEVIGIDNLNTYYSVELKLARLQQQGIETQQIQYGRKCKGIENVSFIQLDITDEHEINTLFENEQFDYIIHLAAQAGVRYSIENPHAYVDSNVKGFLNILEASKNNKVKHLVYASSSSVYGLNEKVPFEEADQTDRQVSLYAATKKANEAMAHSYACVHQLPVTGLRFFTVYGPWGRPDMALFKFTKNMLEGSPIDVYNEGKLSRDFTYITDIVEGIKNVLLEPNSKSAQPYQVFNIGRGKPIALMDFIAAIEKALGTKALLNYMPMQPGDVSVTFASTNEIESQIGYKPKVSLGIGVESFVNWYKEFYNK